MIINRNNYEEFFLLYIDNELSTEEKAAVDAFVIQHPDLQEELQALQQTVLLPEETLSFDKSFLYKEPLALINNNNFEETALLYIDNELSNADKQNFEQYISNNTIHQASLQLLQQTKLPLENIECPNKEALYKKEENKRPIVWMRFARVAVAAVLIGLGVIIYSILPNNTTLNYTAANNNSEKNKNIEKNIAPSVTKSNTVTYTLSDTNNIQMVATIGLQKKRKKENIQPSNIKFAVEKEEITIAKKDVEKENNHLVQSQLSIKDKDALVSIESPKKVKNSEQPISTSSFVATTNEVDIEKNESLAQTTIYKELDTNNENKSLYVGNLELNKDKIRGFLRKASRFLGNKAKNEEESSSKTSFAVNK